MEQPTAATAIKVNIKQNVIKSDNGLSALDGKITCVCSVKIALFLY